MSQSLPLLPLVPTEEDEANEALMILRALKGDEAGLKRCLAKRHSFQPPELFTDFEKSLLDQAKKPRA